MLPLNFSYQNLNTKASFYEIKIFYLTTKSLQGFGSLYKVL